MEVLRHVVGKSTLAEGISVPRQLESWVNAPAAGQKRKIVIWFNGSKVVATLRRLANARGHVQIKYENKAAEPFRQWLITSFPASKNAASGDYLELHKIAIDQYEVIAFPVEKKPHERLEINEWIFHRTDNAILEKHIQLLELQAIIQSVTTNDDNGQAYYNSRLSHFFGVWKWTAEHQVIPEIALKSDFIKDKVIVEVEFGNARTYYQDYVKFMLAHHRKTAEVGVLIVPTEVFARELCKVGQQRARAKGRRSYSGMIHIEKVRRELQHLDFMISCPIVIVGIGMHPPAK